ncbi:MAG: 3'(2'),5'-bisphosphate nucleotidase CysQ, partial [Bacteroidota bacterium]|nr:3'(2'),5'-bisphosphate nucleotidase CysQ [Bacteroidota bacterium]
MKELLLKIINVSIEAGKEIMQIYELDDFGISFKEDNSPLTIADKAANAKIMTVLSTLEYPIISEENKLLEYSERKDWGKFWLVDPLDGTKEFINKNGQFTVNIALIENNVPILGVIYVPVQKELFFGVENIGSYKISNIESAFDNYNELINLTIKLPSAKNKETFKVIASKSHFSDETRAFVDSLKNKHSNLELINIGSSLKFCTIAEGKADIYPRFGPTMEWDIAAGHAIVKYSGGTMINAQ